MSGVIEQVKRLNTPVEIAAPLAVNSYEWRVYSADRGTKYTTTNGKKTTTLRKGSKFGFRQSTSGKADKYRVITEEFGPTIVFTLSESQTNSLINKSKKTKTPAGSKTEPKQKSAGNGAVKARNMAASGKPAPAQTSEAQKPARDLLKAKLGDVTANVVNIKTLIMIGKLLDKFQDPADITMKHVEKLKVLKTSKAKGRTNKDSKAAAASVLAVKQALKYIKQGIASLEGMYFHDAADLLKLSQVIDDSDWKKLSKMSFDTNVREDMPAKLYDVYSDGIYNEANGWRRN